MADHTCTFRPERIARFLTLPSELVSKSGESIVYRFKEEGKTFYLKHYFREPTFKHWLKAWYKSKPETEVRNLKLFKALGISSPGVLAYDIQKSFGQFQQAYILLEGLENTTSLADLVRDKHPLFKIRAWRHNMLQQLAFFTFQIHQMNFAHLDLKWRNVLVSLTDEPQVHWIDCPAGYFSSIFLSQRAFIKDLACLDKVGKKSLSHSDRLRFFKWYKKIDKLGASDKKMIRQIVSFFQNE